MRAPNTRYQAAARVQSILEIEITIIDGAASFSFIHQDILNFKGITRSMSESMMNTQSGRGLRPSDFFHNFLGESPLWYKKTILFFLILNPILWGIHLYLNSNQGIETMGFVAGWILVIQFIFTLAMALRCYPLQPGGLLALEAIALGMASPYMVFDEVKHNLPVILLLMFMVAGVFFMKDLLLFIFTKLLVKVRSKLNVSLMFILVAAVCSAFLDALTVIAVIISVGVGFNAVANKVTADTTVHANEAARMDFAVDVIKFRRFLRNVLMHAAIGTALGGVCTMVGEPQNLLIANEMKWEFLEFIVRMGIVTVPVFFVGLLTCILLEKTKWFSFGATMPVSVLAQLEKFDRAQSAALQGRDIARFIVQGVAAVFLVIALAFHVAEVGLIGLSIIVIQTAWNGVVREHDIGPAFEEALPFTALLVVFFAIVAVIGGLQLFNPIADAVFRMDPSQQPGMFYIANGLLSVMSDNVFVATVYMKEITSNLDCFAVATNVESMVQGAVEDKHHDVTEYVPGPDHDLCNKLAVAVNTGTNIPSVGTPNGQAAFLFLLTSSLAPKLGLSYMRMVVMALPYTLTLGITGWIMVNFFL